jgi:tetratricopeptide (TPR) repeat protein
VNAVLAAPAVGWAADVAALRGRLAAHEAAGVPGPTAAAERLTMRHRLATSTGSHPDELLALLADVDDAVSAFPGWPDLRLLQGSLGLSLHRPDVTAAALAGLTGRGDELTEDLSDQPPVLILSADLALFCGSYAAARERYSAAQRLDPQWDTCARLADVAVATGDPDAAEGWFDAAEDELSAKQMRAFAWVRVQRGDLARATGAADLASSRYDEADRAYPGWWYVTARRAALDAACGRAAQAAAGYRAVLAVVDRPEHREALGAALAACRRTTEADALLRSAVAEYTASVERGEVHYLHHLAAYWAVRDPAVAIGWARRDAEVRRSGATLSTLAWCLHRAGRRVEARHVLREALRMGAGDPLLHARVAEIGV